MIKSFSFNLCHNLHFYTFFVVLPVHSIAIIILNDAFHALYDQEYCALFINYVKIIHDLIAMFITSRSKY